MAVWPLLAHMTGPGCQVVLAEARRQVEFRAWTTDRQLRHAAFKGLWEDEAAEEVVAEEPRPVDGLGPPEPGMRTLGGPPARRPGAQEGRWRTHGEHAAPDVRPGCSCPQMSLGTNFLTWGSSDDYHVPTPHLC